MSTPLIESSPSFEDLYLEEFKFNNPACTFIVENETIVIGSLWNDENLQLVIGIDDKESIIKVNKLILDERFDAIINIESNVIEFVYGYINTNIEHENSFADRKFEFYLDGSKYLCSYVKPTDELLMVANKYRRIDSSTQVMRQLFVFRDGQKIESLSKTKQEYFKNKLPRSFIINPVDLIQSIDIEKIARHVNFLMHYYDRSSPLIIIRKRYEKELVKQVKPKRHIEDCFPAQVAVNSLDDFILQLLDVAGKSNPRFAFIYYYQVFEYAGFYFLDSKVKKELNQFMRDPAIISCPDDKLMQLFVFLSELNHNDETKMRKVIEELCDPKIIWKEIENDKEFFANPIEFDGGFNLTALIAKDTTGETWNSMWMPKLYDHITKIRNCLVHARERRQCNVILPSENNSKKIKRYLPLISRMAEQIALGI